MAAKRAFSLIELVIVVVIIGIVAAIAIPRMGRGSQGAAESSLVADLSVMRKAIDLYTVEHIGDVPTSAAGFADQMTIFTDLGGATSPSQGGGLPVRIAPYQGQLVPKARSRSIRSNTLLTPSWLMSALSMLQPMPPSTMPDTRALTNNGTS